MGLYQSKTDIDYFDYSHINWKNGFRENISNKKLEDLVYKYIYDNVDTKHINERLITAAKVLFNQVINTKLDNDVVYHYIIDTLLKYDDIDSLFYNYSYNNQRFAFQTILCIKINGKKHRVEHDRKSNSINGDNKALFYEPIIIVNPVSDEDIRASIKHRKKELKEYRKRRENAQWQSWKDAANHIVK